MTYGNIKKFFYAAVMLLCLTLLVGSRGILTIVKISSENMRIENNIRNIKEFNSKLGTEIKLLQSSIYYQEKVIRETLGFTKANELVYEFE